MDEEAPEGAAENDEQGDEAGGTSHGGGKAKDEEGDESTEASEDHVDRMGAGVDKEVDMLGGMMDGVEPPEKRELVAPTMAPVEAHFGNEGGEGDTASEWKSRDGGGEADRDKPVDCPSEQGEWEAEKEACEEAVEEVVSKVGKNGLAEEFLRIEGEEPLKRREDDGEDDQPDAKPEDLDQEGEESRIERLKCFHDVRPSLLLERVLHR